MRSLPLGQVDLCMIFIRKFRGIERYNFSQDAKGGTHLLVTVSENNRNSIQISTPKKGDSFYMLITDNSETFAFGRNKKGLYMKDGKTGKEESIS